MFIANTYFHVHYHCNKSGSHITIETSVVMPTLQHSTEEPSLRRNLNKWNSWEVRTLRDHSAQLLHIQAVGSPVIGLIKLLAVSRYHYGMVQARAIIRS